MPQRALVTLGTDGLSDWVQLANGQKLMLGPISALKFVTEVGVGGSQGARDTLDEFIKDGTSMLVIDEDRMADLLKPHRARWTSVQSPLQGSPSLLISPTNQESLPSCKTAGTEDIVMADADKFTKDAISNQVARIESQIALLQTNAKDASPGSFTEKNAKDQIERLKELVSFLNRPSVYGNQSKNDTYYGLPEKLPDGSSAQTKEASVQEHTHVARQILGTLAQTEEKIDQLVLAGKTFDVARAKGDLHRVAQNVHIVVQSSKFKEAGEEVKTALTELGKKASHFAGLFASAKV